MEKFNILKDKYNSPRITGEFLDCSMPMTFDTQSNCGFKCLYCFSQFQRGIGQSADDYLARNVKTVSVERFKKLFTDLDNPKNKFRHLIKNRVTMQFGGLSDPFCPIEEQEGTSYEILKFLKEIKYPICFSSKSNLIVRDPKYLELFDGMQDYWSYKASIITYEADKAAIVEAVTPTPEERLQVLKALSEKGIWTILRLRPFIVGLTDLSYEKLLYKAAEYGVKAVSTEFFCLELRSVNNARAQYETLSNVVGFDIVQFYKNVSVGSGYLRLNYSLKEKYINRMQEICKETGMNLHISDAHHKEKGQSGSCCGLPQFQNEDFALTKFSKFQFTNALQLAKKNGEVCWNDIAQHDVWAKEIMVLDAPGFNSGNNYKREKKCHMTMYDYMRNAWNDPKDANGPYRYFGGIMVPDRLDEEQNIIYKFNYDKSKADPDSFGCSNCPKKCYG